MTWSVSMKQMLSYRPKEKRIETFRGPPNSSEFLLCCLAPQTTAVAEEKEYSELAADKLVTDRKKKNPGRVVASGLGAWNQAEFTEHNDNTLPFVLRSPALITAMPDLVWMRPLGNLQITDVLQTGNLPWECTKESTKFGKIWNSISTTSHFLPQLLTDQGEYHTASQLRRATPLHAVNRRLSHYPKLTTSPWLSLWTYSSTSLQNKSQCWPSASHGMRTPVLKSDLMIQARLCHSFYWFSPEALKSKCSHVGLKTV